MFATKLIDTRLNAVSRVRLRKAVQPDSVRSLDLVGELMVE